MGAHPWFRDPAKPLAYGNLPSALSGGGVASEAILQALCEYQASHKLKRVVLQLLARELPEDRLKALRSQFMALDTDGDGYISVKELITGLQCHGCTASDCVAQLGQVVTSLAGSIGYAEFIAALVWQHEDFHQEELLLACFQKLDRSGCGRICYTDMCSALQGGSVDGPALSESEWEDITVAVGSGGMHDRLEVTFERLVALVEA